MPGDRTGVQTWPSAWDLAWEADGPKAESTLTHEGEEDDEGSGVPGGLERLAALQFPQHFLYYRLQLLRVVHLSWRVPGATCSAHQREPLRTLGSGAGPRTGLPQSSPCPFHTTISGPLFHSSPCSAPLVLVLILAWTAPCHLPQQPRPQTLTFLRAPSARQVLTPGAHKLLPTSGSIPPEALATSPTLPRGCQSSGKGKTCPLPPNSRCCRTQEAQDSGPHSRAFLLFLNRLYKQLGTQGPLDCCGLHE